MDKGGEGHSRQRSGVGITRDATDAWKKGRSHSGGSMDRRWRTSHRPLLGMTFNREERKRKEE